MVIVGADPVRADELVKQLDDLDLRTHPSVFRKGTMACTGIEFCKLAIGETKTRAQWLYAELEQRLPDFDEDIRIHVTGARTHARRFQVADIGLMVGAAGSARRHEVRCLPGAPGRDDGRGGHVRAKVKGVKVYAEDAADYLELLLSRYQQERRRRCRSPCTCNALDADGLARFAAPAARARKSCDERNRAPCRSTARSAASRTSVPTTPAPRRGAVSRASDGSS